MKKLKVEFTLVSGEKEIVEFTTDRPEWSIKQWCRNRAVTDHKVLEEGAGNAKSMLLG